jgi:hypothetical protein
MEKMKSVRHKHAKKAAEKYNVTLRILFWGRGRIVMVG